MLSGFVSVKHWPISELGVPQMLEAGISTYLSHLSAKAHLKKKYSDKQAKTEGTICLFKNTSTINLFCHLLVRSKVNPKSAQASSPHKWGALFPAASSTHISWARDLSQLFGPSDVVHFKQGWPGTASGTLQTQAQMRTSGCTEMHAVIHPIPLEVLGPSVSFLLASMSPNNSSATLEKATRCIQGSLPKIRTTTDVDMH